MEQDQTVCPRCGEPAGGPGFCQACRSHIESLPTSSGVGADASEASYPATRALREVMRLEAALAAASKGISDRIAAGSSITVVEVEPAPGEAETDIDNASSAVAGSNLGQGPREVARFEDLMTIDRRERPESTPPPAAVPEPELSAPAIEEPPALPERQAFWFEYSPALKPMAEAETDAPAAEAEIPTITVEPNRSESVAPPVAEETPAPVQTPHNHWVLVLCLLALAGLVVALTGRRSPTS